MDQKSIMEQKFDELRKLRMEFLSAKRNKEKEIQSLIKVDSDVEKTINEGRDFALKIIEESNANKINKIQVEINKLRLHIERLEENKDLEINEYLKNYTNSPLANRVKSDLEQLYSKDIDESNKKIEELNKQISDIRLASEQSQSHYSEVISDRLKKINDEANKKASYKRVYYRELYDLKEEYRRKMLPLINSLEQELVSWYRNHKQEEGAWQYNYRGKGFLDFTKAFLNFSKEELESIRYSFAPHEQALYEKRKLENKPHAKNNDEVIIIPATTEITQKNQNTMTNNNNSNKSNSLEEIEKKQQNDINALPATIEESNQKKIDFKKPLEFDRENKPKKSHVEDPFKLGEHSGVNGYGDISNYYPDVREKIHSNMTMEKETAVADSVEDFLIGVYKGIIDCAKNLRSLKVRTDDVTRIGATTKDSGIYKLKPISDSKVLLKADNGELINQGDLWQALKNYYDANKNTTYTVKNIDKKFMLSKGKIQALLSSLKEYSFIRVAKGPRSRDKDIINFYSKKSGESMRPIGQFDAANFVLPEDSLFEPGDYINRDEFVAALIKMFQEKKPTWKERISKKIRNIYDRVNSKLGSFYRDYEYEEYINNEEHDHEHKRTR